MKKILILLLIASPVCCLSQYKVFAEKKATVKVSPEPNSSIIFEISVGDSAEAVAYHLGYFRVLKNGESGYVNEVFLRHNISKSNIDSLSMIYDNEIKKNEESTRLRLEEENRKKDEAYAAAQKERLSELTKAYGSSAVAKAQLHKVWIGMPKGLIEFSQHDISPKNKSKITDSKGLIEIWNYPKMTIYLFNNKVYKVIESE